MGEEGSARLELAQDRLGAVQDARRAGDADEARDAPRESHDAHDSVQPV